jgi:hypothetical protein
MVPSLSGKNITNSYCFIGIHHRAFDFKILERVAFLISMSSSVLILKKGAFSAIE